MLDPAPSHALSPMVMRQISWFTPNETEAAFYAGIEKQESLEPTAERLLQQGLRGVVLKLGASGVYLRSQDGLKLYVPAFPVKAVDTTAAGDAFNGAFAVGLARGRSLRRVQGLQPLRPPFRLRAQARNHPCLPAMKWMQSWLRQRHK